VSREGPLPVDKAVDYVLQAAHGLAYVHQNGVVHRDVKPNNLLLQDNGIVLICDLGLARYQDLLVEIDQSFLESATRDGPRTVPEVPKRLQNGDAERESRQDSGAAEDAQNAGTLRLSVTDGPEPAPRAADPPGGGEAGRERGTMWVSMGLSGTICKVEPAQPDRHAPGSRSDPDAYESDPETIAGTAAYMSPEQTRTSRVDRRSDVYNLGCTLFFLLSGRIPFDGDVGRVIQAHVREPAPSLIAARPEVPEQFDLVYRKMVAKRVEERYQSMAEVIRDLDAAREGYLATPRVFICYRREDSLDATDRLYEKLAAHFGEDFVFMDVDTIPPGRDFRQYLSQSVRECDVLLAIIGDHWLGSQTPAGRQRLEDPADFVRLEIQTALQSEIPVVPVLVGQASMPAESELPPCLARLAYHHAAEVRAGYGYARNVEKLIQSIEHLFREKQKTGKTRHHRQAPD
jgi:serine/threonine protein kinase